jgi:hypothetical protein
MWFLTGGFAVQRRRKRETYPGTGAGGGGWNPEAFGSQEPFVFKVA